jgi:hypothetical protein
VFCLTCSKSREARKEEEGGACAAWPVGSGNTEASWRSHASGSGDGDGGGGGLGGDISWGAGHGGETWVAAGREAQAPRMREAGSCFFGGRAALLGL